MPIALFGDQLHHHLFVAEASERKLLLQPLVIYSPDDLPPWTEIGSRVLWFLRDTRRSSCCHCCGSTWVRGRGWVRTSQPDREISIKRLVARKSRKGMIGTKVRAAFLTLNTCATAHLATDTWPHVGTCLCTFYLIDKQPSFYVKGAAGNEARKNRFFRRF